jgi:hypothetical protein
MSWLPGLTRASDDAGETCAAAPEMIVPFREFQPLTPTIITAASGISGCTATLD